MALRKYLVALLAVCASSVALGGTASAAFPDYTGCPTEILTPGELCLNVQAVRGNLSIKGFNVPLGDSLQIRGALDGDEGAFVPARGTNGFIARPVEVPGGLLGIEWIPGTSVQAITELAGPSSAIDVDLETLTVSVPVKVRLVNLLIGMNCHIGTNASPVRLNLGILPTNPPPPNRSISGSTGEGEFVEPDQIIIRNAVNVDNAFAVPGASSCGLGLGLINSLINLKLGLPSAAGNNSIEVTNNIALRVIQ